MSWPIFSIALFYSIVETGYFGWNMSAQSDTEIVCDGIALLIFALAFLRPAR